MQKKPQDTARQRTHTGKCTGYWL